MKRNSKIAELRERMKGIAKDGGGADALRPAYRNAANEVLSDLDDDETKKVRGGTGQPYHDYCVMV